MSGEAAASLHDVDERLAAGERASSVVLAEEAHGLRDGARSRVLDLTQQHGPSLRHLLGDMSSGGTGAAPLRSRRDERVDSSRREQLPCRHGCGPVGGGS